MATAHDTTGSYAVTSPYTDEMCYSSADFEDFCAWIAVYGRSTDTFWVGECPYYFFTSDFHLIRETFQRYPPAVIRHLLPLSLCRPTGAIYAGIGHPCADSLPIAMSTRRCHEHQ